jgi:hypothetical protein
MDRAYDIFEVLPDGTPIWKATVQSHEEGIQRLKELSEKEQSEYRMVHTATKAIIATTGKKETNPETK